MLSISSYTDGAIEKCSPCAKIVRVGNFVHDEFFEVPYVRLSKRARAISSITRYYPTKASTSSSGQLGS